MEKKVIGRIMAVGVLTIMFAVSGCNYLGPCVNGSGPVISEIRDISSFTGVINSGSFDVYVRQADSFGVELVAQENLFAIIETYVSGNHLIIETKNNTCYRSSSAVEIHVALPELDHLRLAGSGKVIADIAIGTEVEVSNSGSGWMALDTVYAESYMLNNSGSGQVYIEAVYAPEASLVQSGSGFIGGGFFFGTADLSIRHSSSGGVSATVLDGTVVDLILSGSGKIALEGDAALAEFSLNSSGRVEALNLEVSDVDATNTGSGDVFLWATDLLDATISGSGDIIYRGSPLVSKTITGSGSVRPY